MSRTPGWIAAVVVVVAGTPAAAASEVACDRSAPAAVLVHVTGLKSGVGSVRVQAYGADPAAFLAKGRWLRRVEVQPGGRRTLDVCLSLPGAGRYAIAVRHDVNGNRKSDWNDGGGFSRNPRLSLFHLKPAFDQVVTAVRAGVTRLEVVMNYRHGLSVGPEGGG